MKKLIKYSLVLLAFTVSVVTVIYFLQQKQTFQVVYPKRGNLKEAIYGLGTVTSTRIYEHKLGVVSAIRKLYVQVGDQVKKGQRLIEFDGTSPLFSPIEGTVTNLPFHENENVFPQVPVIRVEDLSARVIEVGLEQLGALRVRLGQNARLSFENMRGMTFEGKVSSLYPTAGQFIVRIDAAQLPPEILPGMTVDAAIQVGEKQDILLIPAAAILSGRVTLVEGKKRRKQEVQVGGSDGEWVEVLSQNITTESALLVPKK
jgi:multidrug efflux pump subunit AcrA (membrane-fusion protein)